MSRMIMFDYNTFLFTPFLSTNPMKRLKPTMTWSKFIKFKSWIFSQFGHKVSMAQSFSYSVVDIIANCSPKVYILTD